MAKGFSIKKVLISSVSAGLIVALVVWLWGQQPQPQSKTVLSQKAATEEAQAQKEAIDPPDTSILKSQKTKLKGLQSNLDYMVVYSNNFFEVLKTEPNKNYELDLDLAKGVNLIKITEMGSDLKKGTEKTLTYLMDSAGDTKEQVFTGTAKSIFDTLITINTEDGEKSIRTGKSTKFDIPKIDEDDPEASKGSEINDIRIGDYIIALGTPPEKTSQETILATSLEVVRTNKPQLNKKLSGFTITTTPKNNSFSAKNLDDSKTINLTLTKNSQIIVGDKSAKAADIAKDKNAIIIYTQADKDVNVDLIYLLP